MSISFDRKQRAWALFLNSVDVLKEGFDWPGLFILEIYVYICIMDMSIGLTRYPSRSGPSSQSYDWPIRSFFYTRNKCIIMGLFFFPIFSVSAQYNYRLNPSGFQLFEGSFAIEQPFIGGFNSPQFSQMDLNGDKQTDMLVFDRYDAKLLPFIRTKGDVFLYAPEYESALPKGLYFYKTADLNSDGKLDVFTLSESGDLQIYINKTPFGSKNLSFHGLGNLYYRNQFDSTFFNLYNPLSFSKFDMPEISDIDGDGDLDIVSYDQGNYTYREFRDVRAEKGWPKDTFEFQIMDVCFGYFNEGFDNSIALGECPYKDKLSPRHTGGSSCLMFDFDADGDKEMLISNIGFYRFVFLENGRKNVNHKYDTMIRVDTLFPQNTVAANKFNFPAAYLIDASGDGVQDLLISPNDFVDVKETQQIWYYQNNGVANKPNFQFVKTNFLSEKTLDLGARSAPVFVDIDADGDKDLLVANNGDYAKTQGKKDRLALFENTGTKTKPIFQLKTLDYLTLSDSNYQHMVPTVGDIDGDGDQDLLLGLMSGKIACFQNKAGPNKAVQWEFQTPNLLNNIPAIGESNAAPCVYDFNKDGIADILLGHYNGRVSLFEGSKLSEKKYTLRTQNAWGARGNEWRADISQPNWKSYGYSVPLVTDLNGDGRQELLVGTGYGYTRLYQIDGHPYTDSLLNDTNWLLQYGISDSTMPLMGSRIIPTAAELTGDSLQEIVFGLGRGGLIWAASSATKLLGIENSVLERPSFRIYPNPSSTYAYIERNYTTHEQLFISVYTVQDACVYKTVLLQSEKGVGIPVANLAPGMYFVKMTRLNGQCAVEKLWVTAQ